MRRLTTNAATKAATSQRSFNAHLDYKRMRARVVEMTENMRNRNLKGAETAPTTVADLYDRRNALDHSASNLRKDRNLLSSEMARLAKQKNTVLLAEMKGKALALKSEISAHEAEISSLDAQLFEEARHLPNDTCPTVPIGPEDKAEVLEIVGTQPAAQDGLAPDQFKSHVDLCTLHSIADFTRASKVSGSGFYFLKNFGALMELALSRYAIDTCIQEHGFTPICPPDVIRHEVLEACGFSPRANVQDPQTYFLSTHLDADHLKAGYDPLRLCLAATAEFPLAAMHAGEVFKPSELPVKYVGLGRAFRAEGLAGGVNRGLYRVHQFSKVEMFGIVAGGEGGLERSLSMMEEFKDIQKSLFEGLEICFRILNMPTEELGAPAYKKYDMEAWMPGRNSWGEISSTSNCTDYQSRRLNIRNFSSGGGQAQASKSTDNTGSHSKNLDYVHTVNGTAAAIPRLIIALVETHQKANGDIHIPERLRPYILGGRVDTIKAGESFGEMMARLKK
ncbi:seryl-tRNA synthetase [Chytriomyces hyalinus]|nr:seryl-tRNA synthetase [Chytriomyces hyalinus]